MSFSHEVYKNMTWIDPANWISTKTELQCLEKMVEHFKVPLEHHGFTFESPKLKAEWKDLKHLVRNFYPGVRCKKLWKQILQYRMEQFPNICLLAQIVLAIGVSNSVVESGFSHLSSMLTDRRLSLNHSTMEDLLLLKINHHSWVDSDRDEIITSALKKYTRKRRCTKLDNTPFNMLGIHHVKRKRQNSDSSSSSSSSDNVVEEISDQSDTEHLSSSDDDDDFIGFESDEVEAAENRLLGRESDENDIMP